MPIFFAPKIIATNTRIRMAFFTALTLRCFISAYNTIGSSCVNKRVNKIIQTTRK